MKSQDSQHEQIEAWNYTIEKVNAKNPLKIKTLLKEVNLNDHY